MASKRSCSLKISSPYPCRTMDHHKEESADLLSPSESNDGPSFPASATWSEAGISSPSATLVEPPFNTPQRIRLGGTPGVIAGLLFGAALTALLHHVYLFILRGRTVSGQFWIKNSSNVLSTLVQWLCMGSVSVSLTQLIWWLLRRRPFTILQLNHLFGLPDPLRILHLASSRRLWSAIPVITMATLLQAFALVSILAPNSLEVGSASPQNTTISVPTIFFSKAHIYDELNAQAGPAYYGYPSASLQKVLDRALQSDTLIGWNAPAGCGTACNYTIQYPAPALRCTELSPDEANTMLFNSDLPAAYNATVIQVDGGLKWSTCMSMAWRTYHAGEKVTSAASGANCSIYNTTQQAVISFVNNTGMISPSILSYADPVMFDWDTFYSNGPTPEIVSAFSYMSVVTWLYTQLSGVVPSTFPMNMPASCPASASLGSSNVISTNLFSVNESAGTFTPNRENMSSALEQILVNVTVALITSMGHTTMANASVVQDQLVWVYHGQRLWIIYATALAVTATCGAIGVACMLKDGEGNDLAFWDIVRATRNSELDAVVEGDKRGDAGKDTMLQYAAQGKDSDTNTSGVFVLARSPHEESS
ncbi:hypothetical protein EV421DRAFT_2024551 [Armillaria borealis]|uniref:Uncharacterized protein n=1 Tax=Armillaria borealis TaxID=47425 RepID=A0AA39MFB0_9AGAR|nr:hypothetical protein EV421DRAFT_2024551 [Armillaria borealis]